MLLFGTMGYASYLRPDGSVWVQEDEDWTGPQPQLTWREAGTQEAAGAIRRAALRLPTLAPVLPTRPASADACDECRGSGHLTRGDAVLEGVWCSRCCGVGWLIADAI
jgi:hypothetical protein